jgi:hypothetical protein
VRIPEDAGAQEREVLGELRVGVQTRTGVVQVHVIAGLQPRVVAATQLLQYRRVSYGLHQRTMALAATSTPPARSSAASSAKPPIGRPSITSCGVLLPPVSVSSLQQRSGSALRLISSKAIPRRSRSACARSHSAQNGAV